MSSLRMSCSFKCFNYRINHLLNAHIRRVDKHGILSLLPRYGDDTATVVDVAGDALKAIDEYGRAHFGA